MYVSAYSLGADLVTSSANQAAAEAEILRIQKENNARNARYLSDMSLYSGRLAAREKIIADNAKAQKAYDKAYANYAAKGADVASKNATLQARYQAELSGYQAAKRAYDAAVGARSSALAARAAASAPILARAGGAPASYAGCLTQAQRDAFAQKCQTAQHKAETVRGVGFGAFGLVDLPECVWQSLPLCTALPTLPANPGNPPTPPTLEQLPQKPQQPSLTQVPPEPQKPVPPTRLEVPTLVVDDSQKRGMVVAGLLAVVVVGGGAAWYFTHKKKKVA